MTDPQPKSYAWIIASLLVVLVLGLYGRAAWFDFVEFDDPEYVRDNPHVQAGLTGHSVTWAIDPHNTLMGNWNPLVWLSLMADRELFGPGAGGFHFTNIVLHAINVMLLFLVLRSMTRQDWTSALAAALFAVHPLHVESVAWIPERKDVLSTLFWLLTIGAYVHWVHQRTWWRYAIMAGCFVLGLLSKPMLVTLPFVLLLLDLWPLRRVSWSPDQRRSWLTAVVEKLPLFAISAAWCAIAFIAQSQQQAVAHLSLGVRLGNAVISYVRYLGKAFWPVDLSVIYPHPSLTGGADWPLSMAMGALVMLILLTTVTFIIHRNRPWMLVGWLWFLGTLVPVIGIVQIGYHAMADRYAYVPLIGIHVLVAWTLAEIARKLPRLRSMVIGLSAVALVALSLRTWNQIGVWRDSSNLFDHALQVKPDNWIVHAQYAPALERLHQPLLAIDHLRTAIEIHPRSAGLHNSLGALLGSLGQLDEARAELEQAIALEADHPQAHANLAAILQRQGELENAITHLRTAVRLKSNVPQFHKNLGLALALHREFDAAQAEIELAIRISGEDADEYRRALQQVQALQARDPKP